MFAVVGLGNPGERYAQTRHNAGHMVIASLASRAGGALRAHRATHTHTLSTRIGTVPGESGEQVILATCDCFMNVSGGPVKALLAYFNAGAEGLLVIHDDLDLPFGTLRLKRGGGEGGHNGLKSISQALGTRDYLRLRFGVGRPPGRQDPADFVLRPFAAAERRELPTLVDKAADAVEDVLTRGFEAAQMRLHTAH
ncbi:aminoacyl-tRNA hydrolase [Actinobaculum sp. 352]|uniref:aminoacyl-tRNA hydrolase n=1 Tax=Actinobaculum sp. 352 TaxID=2490946 RepID=UPI000F7DF5D4|nr:aminoacyl-tRNA hydrolase [Actinobaculum sp. 352]MBE6484991.1 aminoacyl-tRNA hydrolase [Actinomycetaceae bacterium]RTE50255.1 aminoacyl-tRNA hydrolase [Actinobaculum sp. 352]